MGHEILGGQVMRLSHDSPRVMRLGHDAPRVMTKADNALGVPC